MFGGVSNVLYCDGGVVNGALVIVLFVLRSNDLQVFLFHSGYRIFKLNIFGCEAGYFFLLTENLGMSIEEEVFFGEMLLRRAEELVVERYAFMEVLRAILEEHVAALPSTKTVCALEHSGKYDEGDKHHFLIMPDGAVRKRIVFPLIARTGGRKHIRRKKMRRVHHSHDRDINRHIVCTEMGLHGV